MRWEERLGAEFQCFHEDVQPVIALVGILTTCLGILQKIIVGFTVLLAERTTGASCSERGVEKLMMILLQSQEIKPTDAKLEINQAGENK